jgi:hypothetical protein
MATIMTIISAGRASPAYLVLANLPTGAALTQVFFAQLLELS